MPWTLAGNIRGPAGSGGSLDTAAVYVWTNTHTHTAPNATTPAHITKAAASQTGAVWRLVDSNNVVQAEIDATGVYRSGGRRTAPLTSRLTANASSTSTSYSSTGLSLTTAAGAVYMIRAIGSYQTAATTTGIGLQIGGTTTATSIRTQNVTWGVTATTATQFVQVALAPGLAKSTAVATANNPFPFSIEGLIQVNAAGTLDLQFATEVAGSAAIVHANSYLMLQEIA
jgi:hypothetical protein